VGLNVSMFVNFDKFRAEGQFGGEVGQIMGCANQGRGEGCSKFRGKPAAWVLLLLMLLT